MSNIENNVLQIQVLYPKIYFACHQQHSKAKSAKGQLTDRDLNILVHIFDGKYRYNKELANHLNVAPSTMSEALNHLVALKVLLTKIDDNDQRRTRYLLTDAGRTALQESSVLDSNKLTKMLNKLNAEQQTQVLQGLQLLADAGN
ncbi:MAG: winged helix-turn-helix transcriptional regulator [Oceanospirillaceae bacterium]|nr:winged helix-turn-helix transcriptional regulator [Oceanospirillaceae bacterium]